MGSFPNQKSWLRLSYSSIASLIIGYEFVLSSQPYNKILIARLGKDLDWSVSASLIFTEIARLPKRLLFLPAQICCANKIKLISA